MKEKIKNHIEEMGNGNSKRLAYYIFIGVLSVFANFAMAVVDRVIESNKKNPSDVYEQIVSMKEYDKEYKQEQTKLLRELTVNVALMNQTQTRILIEIGN